MYNFIFIDVIYFLVIILCLIIKINYGINIIL